MYAVSKAPVSTRFQRLAAAVSFASRPWTGPQETPDRPAPAAVRGPGFHKVTTPAPSGPASRPCLRTLRHTLRHAFRELARCAFANQALATRRRSPRFGASRDSPSALDGSRVTRSTPRCIASPPARMPPLPRLAPSKTPRFAGRCSSPAWRCTPRPFRPGGDGALRRRRPSGRRWRGRALTREAPGSRGSHLRKRTRSGC